MTDDPGRFLDLAVAAVRAAVGAGASHAEAMAGRSRGIAVDVENSSVKRAEAGHGESLGLRAFVDGAAGFVSVEGLERTDVQALGRQAAQLAASATPDPHFVDLPHPDPAPEIEGLYDEAVERLDVAEAVRVAAGAIEEARAVCHDVALQGDVGFEVAVGALANSNGVEVVRRTTTIQFGYFAVVRDGDRVGSFQDFDLGRNLADVEWSGLGRRVTEEALRFLGGRLVETGRRDLVLGPLAAYGFVQSILGAANAESVQRGRSYLVNRLGTRIASPVLTVVDDPLVPRGIRSGAHDGEGTRRRRRAVIEAGVLATYLHNSYTASKAGVASTGHATPGGGIAPTNVQIALGARPAADLIAEVEDGLYIEPGAFSPDPVSGDVSGPIDFGFRIEGGQLTHAVLNCIVGGTVWELLDHLDAVSADFRSEPGTVMPTIRIRDILVASGA